MAAHAVAIGLREFVSVDEGIAEAMRTATTAGAAIVAAHPNAQRARGRARTSHETLLARRRAPRARASVRAIQPVAALRLGRRRGAPRRRERRLSHPRASDGLEDAPPERPRRECSGRLPAHAAPGVPRAARPEHARARRIGAAAAHHFVTTLFPATPENPRESRGWSPTTIRGGLECDSRFAPYVLALGVAAVALVAGDGGARGVLRRLGSRRADPAAEQVESAVRRRQAAERNRRPPISTTAQALANPAGLITVAKGLKVSVVAAPARRLRTSTRWCSGRRRIRRTSSAATRRA